MFKKTKQKNKQKKSGFTILIAVVTAGILLIIAMSIGGIALKEQVLSSANKESQVAYYAADAGMECALYWDQVQGAFIFEDTDSNAVRLNHPTCNGQEIYPTTEAALGSTNYTYTIMLTGLKVGDSTDTTCSVATINKTLQADGLLHTTIQSYGYNTCKPSLRRIERGIVATYP